MDVLPSAKDKGRDLAVWHQVGAATLAHERMDVVFLCIGTNASQAMVLPNMIATPLGAGIKSVFDKVL